MDDQRSDAVIEVRESLVRASSVSELLTESRRLRELAVASSAPTGLFLVSQVLSEIARARDERPLDPQFVHSVSDRLVPLLEELLDAVADHPDSSTNEMDALVSEFLMTTITPPGPQST